MSGGRLTVERYPVGEPFPATEALDGVGKGMCEVAFNGGFYLAGVEAALGPICSRPGTAMDRLEQLNAFCESSEFREIVQQVFNRHNCYHLASMTNTTTGVLSKVPVSHLSDFKGIRIRSCPPRDMVFTKLGAAATYVATPEIYSALQLGTIDAVDKGNYATEFGLKLHEVTKYIVEPQFWAPENLIDIFVNMDAWNELTPDLQAIVQGSARMQARHYAYETSLLNAIAREKMIDYGLEVTTIPAEEMVEAYKIGPQVWDEMASECDECAKVIEIYKKFYKQFGYSLD